MSEIKENTEFLLRVTNTSGDTLFVGSCFLKCLDYIKTGPLSLQGYRIEVMKHEG